MLSVGNAAANASQTHGMLSHLGLTLTCFVPNQFAYLRWFIRCSRCITVKPFSLSAPSLCPYVAASCADRALHCGTAPTVSRRLGPSNTHVRMPASIIHYVLMHAGSGQMCRAAVLHAVALVPERTAVLLSRSVAAFNTATEYSDSLPFFF